MTDKKPRTGLDALLPVEPETGPNTWVLEGWETRQEGNEVQVVLVLDGMYKTRAMRSNLLLQTLRKFELANPALLFKNANGGITYKQRLAMSFSYSPNVMGGRRFKSAYSDVNIRLEAAQGDKKAGDIAAFV